MGIYCVAFNCKSIQIPGDKSVSFHRFPHSRPYLLEQWTRAVRREQWKPTKYSRLCSKHFTNEDYQIRPGAETKLLLVNAVPSIFDFPQHLQKPVKKRRVLERKISLSTSSYISIPSSTNVNIKENTTSEEPVSTLHSPMTTSLIRQKSPTKDALRRKIRLLQAKLRRRDAKITSMTDLITVLKKKGCSNDNLNVILENHFSGFSLDLFKNEIKNQNVSRNGKRYTTPFKEFALTLYFYSPRAYRYVRKLIQLPHPSVIKGWLSTVNCEPGLLQEVFNYLKVKVHRMPHLQNCSLIFDSMAIRKQICWNNKLGKHTGFIDCAGIVDGNSENLATEALVFQIVSLTGNFKCPIAYFFVAKISSNLQAEIIKMCLIKLEEVGVHIHSITCDGASSNIQTLKLLGCVSCEDGSLTCSFPHPLTKDEVFAYLDPCHMLKLARNTLSEKGFISSVKGVVKWDLVSKLNDLQEKEGLKLANSLSGAHINYKNKKMNVKLAAQTLSSGVADALQYLEKIKYPGFENCEATIYFIQLIDRLFDFLNSRNPFASGFKQALRLKNKTYWEGIFNETADYLSSLYIENVHIFKHPRKTFALGFVLCINSIQKLALRLLSEIENPLAYFLTYKLSQDHLELFFSCVRSRGGANNNPNTEQFKWALRKLLFRNSISASSNSNCLDLEAESHCSILNFRSPKRSIVEHVSSEQTDDEVSKYISVIDMQSLSDFVDNILYYIAGYICRKIIKKLSCAECHKMLINSSAFIDHTYSSEQLSFQKFTNCVSRGCLILASNAVYRIVHYTERAFKLLIVKQGLICKDDVDKLIINCVVKHFSQAKMFTQLNFQHSFNNEFGCEELHLMQMIRTISSVYCKLRMFDYAKKFTLKVNSNSSTIRQKMSKMILFHHV